MYYGTEDLHCILLTSRRSAGRRPSAAVRLAGAPSPGRATSSPAPMAGKRVCAGRHATARRHRATDKRASGQATALLPHFHRASAWAGRPPCRCYTASRRTHGQEVAPPPPCDRSEWVELGTCCRDGDCNATAGDGEDNEEDSGGNW